MSFEQYCNHLLPYAIRYGMPIDYFWHREADLFFAYRSAFLMAQEEELDRSNKIAWLSGAYTLQALWEVHSYINLPKEEKHLAVKYHQSPINIFDTKETKETKDDIIKKKRIEEENKIKLMIAQTQIALREINRKQKKEVGD